VVKTLRDSRATPSRNPSIKTSRGRESMTQNEWLASLKVGDTVMEYYDYGNGRELRTGVRTPTVDRITKTQIITSSCGRFRRTDGVRIGGGWSDKIVPFNKEKFDEIRKEMRWYATKNRVLAYLHELDTNAYKRIKDDMPLEILRKHELALADMTAALGITITLRAME
jgi:hypothetical protein